MALTIIVTNAGRAALVNAANTGTAPVTIAQVGFSATAVAPTPTAVALPDEFKRLDALSGDVVADDTIHIIVRDEGTDVFTVRSLALYLADGTLFAIYGQADVIVEKSAQSMLLLAIDVKFEDVDAAAITFGDANFLNPPATTAMQGVVELATDAESETGVDAQRAVTPKGMKAAVTSWLNSRFGEGAPSTFVKNLLTAASAVAFRGALSIKSAALKDEGAGNGLDADLLDGQHGSYYTNITARLGFTPLNAGSYTAADILVKIKSVDGSGSGLDADLFDGQHASYYTNISARLGYTPLDTADYTAADIRAKLVTVDGSGSGIDADLLDGLHASAFARSTSSNRPGVTRLYRDDADSGYYLRTRYGNPYWILEGYNSSDAFHADVQVGNSARLNGQLPSYYTDIAARLGYTPLNSASYTAADVKAKLLSVDGPSSGINADLLDGLHASAFQRVTSSNMEAIDGYRIFADGTKETWSEITIGKNATKVWTLPTPHSSWVHPTCGVSSESFNTGIEENTGISSINGSPPTSITFWNADERTVTVWVRTIGV